MFLHPDTGQLGNDMGVDNAHHGPFPLGRKILIGSLHRCGGAMNVVTRSDVLRLGSFGVCAAVLCFPRFACSFRDFTDLHSLVVGAHFGNYVGDVALHLSYASKLTLHIQDNKNDIGSM